MAPSVTSAKDEARAPGLESDDKGRGAAPLLGVPLNWMPRIKTTENRILNVASFSVL